MDDSHQREQNEMALYSELMSDGIPGITLLIDYDFRILSFNSLFSRFFGYLSRDIVEKKMRLTDLMDEAQRFRFLKHLGQVKGRKEELHHFVIYQLRAKNSEQITCSLYASPIGIIKDGDPKEFYSLLLHPDFSSWEIPYTSFNTQQLFLEHFKNDQFGSFEWILGPDTFFYSTGIFQIYDLPDFGRFPGGIFSDELIHPADVASLRQSLQEVIEKSSNHEFEYRIITPQKKVKTIHCIGRSIGATGKGVSKISGSIRDISVFRTTEEALKSKVRELYHSNKELEEFAFVASHDLQEPLRKITTFSGRLKDKYQDLLQGEGAMYLSRVIASAGNMRSLINDLLEFSRITTTNQPFEEVDLDNILKLVLTELELTIEESGTEIHSDHLPVMEAIPSQMKQVFCNIISNAIKFRKSEVPARIDINVSVITQYDLKIYGLDFTESYYKLVFSDNGIGFEQEYASRIFQVFQRLHGKSEFPGAGIGLAICKKIIDYHHGRIYAESMPGSGSRFVCILPVRQVKSNAYSL